MEKKKKKVKNQYTKMSSSTPFMLSKQHEHGSPALTSRAEMTANKAETTILFGTHLELQY